MLNQTLMVGRIVDTPVLVEEDGKKFTILKLSVPRSFKNDEGEYENDVIPVKLLNSIAETTVEYTKQGDLVGVKGRLEATPEGLKVVADKVTFLSSKKDN